MLLKLMTWLLAALTLTAATAHADPVLQRAQERGSLTVAIVPDKLPLAARDSDGGFAGFDVEVAEALAKRLGLSAKFVTPGWDAILNGQWQGKWDFAVASITPTKPREERLNFPVVYRMDAAVVAVRKGEQRITRPQEASGRKVGVKRRTTFERYLRQELTLDEIGGPVAFVIERPNIVMLADHEDTLQALVDGKVDAIVTNLALVEAARKNGRPVQVLPGFLYFEPVAVATAKGDPEFDARIKEAVVAMQKDGSLSALSARWFGIDLGTLVP
jgi:polar amino acid transport system substrate-binding protein